MPDKILLDFENEELARIDDEIELDSALFRREGDGAWTIEEPSVDTIRIEQCFSLLGPNTFAFGHWLFEYLPRLWIALQSGLMPRVPILIDQGMNRQHRQCLELILPDGTQIIEVKPMQRVEVGRLWFAPTFYYAPIYPQFNSRFRYDYVAAPPDRFRQIFQELLARMMPAIGPLDGAEKIYLARKPGSHRKMLNHQAIEEVAKREGFRCVYPEDMDFIEQLRLVRQAKHLVGPEGSAFFMAFFARPGTRTCVLNHPHTEYLTTVTALLEAAQVDCTVLTGPFRRVDPDDYVHHSDYEIDAEGFSDFLKRWSRQ
jgi:capsular polysaccharide biosynthesis protein